MKWLVAMSVSFVMVNAAHAAADVEAGKAKVAGRVRRVPRGDGRERQRCDPQSRGAEAGLPRGAAARR